MLRALLARLREAVAVDDPEDRIEGSGEAIRSPQHRRSPDAERELRRLQEAAEESRDDRS